MQHRLREGYRWRGRRAQADGSVERSKPGPSSARFLPEARTMPFQRRMRRKMHTTANASRTCGEGRRRSTQHRDWSPTRHSVVRGSNSYEILTRQLCILYNGLGHGPVSASALVPPFKEDGSCQRWRGEGKEVRCRRRGEDRRVDGGSEKPWAQGVHRRRACHFTGGEEQKDDYFLLR